MFITLFGQFCFNQLAFSLTSVPEHFKKRMLEILAGVEGVVCMVDNILVSRGTHEQHQQRLDTMLERISKAGVTLNADKCAFAQPSVCFLGQIVDTNGIRSDQSHTCNAAAHECH